jgi:hypothetical protein
MRIKGIYFIAFLFIISSCSKKKDIVSVDLRTELVNHTFVGTMNVDNKFYSAASNNFMRGGIMDPFYLVSISYANNNLSGLIEVLEDNTFTIAFKFRCN